MQEEGSKVLIRTAYCAGVPATVNAVDAAAEVPKK